MEDGIQKIFLVKNCVVFQVKKGWWGISVAISYMCKLRYLGSESNATIKKTEIIVSLEQR